MFTERNIKSLKIVGALVFGMVIFPLSLLRLLKAFEIESETSRTAAAIFAFVCILVMMNLVLSKIEHWRE